MTLLGRADLDERFEVLDTLGRGSFGVVHRVRDRRTGASFALKLLTGQGELGRTQRELEVSLQLDHPHVVQCHAGALTEDGGYLLLELCEGSLAGLLVDRTRRPQAWELLAQTADGLAAIHARGLVHRDMKPTNVLLRGGEAKVADLGLVRGGDLGTMTEEGMVLGTPAFMSPEQARGERVGPACDVFALGVMIYDFLEGHLPYPDEPPMVRLGRVAKAKLYPWKRALGELPGPALELVQAMLAPDPSRRPADLAEVARVLRAHPPRSLDRPGEASVAAPRLTQSLPRARARRLSSTAPRGLHKPTRRPRRSRTPAVFGLLVLATVLGVLWPEPRSTEPSGPSPVDTGPFPADYLTRLDRELEWASHQVIRSDGTLRPAAEGAPGNDERDLLTWDPHGWFASIERLPEVRRFHAWLGQGGRPEDLSEDLLEGLRAIDDAYEKRRFRRVFEPRLYVGPTPGEGPVPGFPNYPPAWQAPPPTTDPWRRAATEHLLRYLYGHHELEQQIYGISRGETSEAPASITRIFRAPIHLVSDMLERRALLPLMLPAWRERRNRPRLGAWIAPLNQHLERFFACASQSLDSSGARDWLVWVITGPLPTHELGDLGPMAFAPPEAILGQVPATPDGELLLASFLRRQIHGRELLGHPVAGLRHRRAAILAGLLAQVDFATIDTYAQHILRMALHEYQILQDGPRFREVFRRYLPKLIPHAPRAAYSLYGYLRTARKLDDPLPFSRDELTRLRHELTEALATNPRNHSLVQEVEHTLDQLVARAPEVLAPELAPP